MNSKKSILQHIVNLIKENQIGLKKEVADLQNALASETKSSAGDKYETSREMITQEMNKVSDQLNIQTHYLQKLEKINPSKVNNEISENALVTTSIGQFFIGLPLGMIKINNENIYFISAASPIYQPMKGLKTGEHFTWQKKKISIIEVK